MFRFMNTVLLTLGMMQSGTLLAAEHPLDPLSEKEIGVAVNTLWDAGRVDKTSRFSTVRLAEPDKSFVLGWQPGDDFPRHAYAALRHERELVETVIDVETRRIVSWEVIEGQQPPQIADEFILSQQIVRKDPAWLEAIEKRGIDNPKSLVCVPSLPGYFGPEEDPARRLGRVACYDASGKGNLWGRPIEGLIATVDFDEGKVVHLYDSGPVTMGTGGPAVAKDTGGPMPARSSARKTFRVDGHAVEWGNWRFRLHVDPRTGPVVSRVEMRDPLDESGAWRSVLYRGEPAEMFVPYMDPGEAWYYRAFLDIGEYGIGASGTPLQAGRDCPRDAVLMDATFADHMGRAVTKKGLICVFERLTGDVGWTHYEISQSRSRSNRGVELVARFAVWLGNYDYLMDWIFTSTGSLKGRIGATGVVQVKAVEADSVEAPTAAADTAYGRMILPHTVAVNHDHFFAFRLDLDVDGPVNSLSIDRLRRVDLDPRETGTPLTNVWQVFPEIAARESDAMLTIDPRKPALWRVINPAVRNQVGDATSIQLSPGGAAVPLTDPGGLPHTRASFADHHLWVTPYDADERYPAGEYPNQHPGGAGLPAWTAGDRGIENTDIVLWYTLGMHHVVRAEDWPIMPLLQKEFELRPFGFLAQNPDVPADD